MTKRILKFTRLAQFDSAFLSRLFFKVGILLAFSIFGADILLAHVHIEIEVPDGTWERIHDSENHTSAEKVWNDPESASKRDHERAAEWSYDHGG